MLKLRWLFVGACFPWLFIGFCTFLISGYFVLHSTEEFDYGEGVVLWQATHVTEWATAYHPVEVYPHLVFEYTPLYHLVSRAIALATGDLQIAGRLVSLLSTASICIVLALLAWFCQPPGTDRFTRSIAATCAGLLIFTTVGEHAGSDPGAIPVWFWSCLMRVDMLALLFTFSGIALFIFARLRPALAYAAFLLFVAAVYTKQLMIAAPVVCLLLLLIESPKRAIRVSMVAIAVGLGALVMLQIATHGFFWRNVFSYDQNPFKISKSIRMWEEHFPLVAPVLSSALVLPALFLIRVPWRLRHLIRHLRSLLRRNLFSRALTVTGTFLGLAIVVSTACGKEGANVNYFLEADFSAILACALFLGWLMANRPERIRGFHLALTLFVTLLLALHSVRAAVASRDFTVHNVWPPQPQYSVEMVNFLKNTQGPVYSENMTVLMLAGQQIPAEPAIITSLVKTNQWDESSFVERLAGGRFRAVVVTTTLDNSERFTPNVKRSIEQRYTISRKIGPFKIYTPRR